MSLVTECYAKFPCGCYTVTLCQNKYLIQTKYLIHRLVIFLRFDESNVEKILTEEITLFTYNVILKCRINETYVVVSFF